MAIEIEITRTIGDGPTPAKPRIPVRYASQWGEWRVQVEYQHDDDTRPMYQLTWRGAGEYCGFSAHGLRQMLPLFEPELRAWLEAFLDHTEAMEADRRRESVIDAALPVGLTVTEEP